MLGHNRHATKGNSGDPEGAHPFQHDNITLVHNGSLTSHNELTDDYFMVDSEAICKAIAVDGIEVVGPKLRGAFALVWIDSDSNTLNFLRNEERPLAIAWNKTTNRMWWASEKRMLEWSITRDSFTRSPVVYEECFELPVGKLISIPITHTSINIRESVESEIDVSDSVPAFVYDTFNRNYTTPKLTTTASTGGYNAKLSAQAVAGPAPNETVTPFRFGNTRETALQQLSANIVNSRGRDNFMIRSLISSLDMNADSLVLDERIGVFITGWEPYSSTGTNGTIQGQAMEHPYSPVVIHGFTEEEYLKLCEATGSAITAYISGFVSPRVGDINVRINVVMPDVDARTFTISLRKDSIRTANTDIFYWELDEIPKENTKALKLAEDILVKESLDLPDFTVAEDPLRIFKLVDGSEVSIGGSAKYSGNLEALQGDFRYKVTGIKHDDTTQQTMLICTLGTKDYSLRQDKFFDGALSKEILDAREETATEGKWLRAVSKGCCLCGVEPTDFKLAESLVWLPKGRFYCGPCNFDLINADYR